MSSETEDKNNYLAYLRIFSLSLKRGFLLHGRPLAYASEFGESMRPIAPKWFVNGMYGLSIGYVVADTAIKTYEIRDQGSQKMLIKAGDLSLWHTFASMILPAVSIHTIVKTSGHGLNNLSKMGYKFPRWGKFLPTAFGLASIPFIIHPLDHLTDYVMNQTIRKFYTIPQPIKIPHDQI